MIDLDARSIAMPLGVVLRRQPGVTRWAAHAWRATAVLPGAAAADWHELRRDGDAVDFHAATVPLTLHRTDTEAYRVNLADGVPSVYVVMRELDRDSAHPYEVLLVTVSPFEAQDYADSGEEIVEKVPMPPGLIAWVRDYALHHHIEETFKKRRRDRKDIDLTEDGIGDARIAQVADVYRAPGSRRKARLQ